MSMSQHVVRAATMGAIGVLVAVSLAAAEEGGRYRLPTTTKPTTYSAPTTTNAGIDWPSTANPAKQQARVATRSTKRLATTHMRKRSPRDDIARSAPDPKAHRLILQVNTNDPAA